MSHFLSDDGCPLCGGVRTAGTTTLTAAAYGVSALPDGSSIVAGYFYATANFGDTELVSAGDWDAFVAKLSASGEWEWAVGAFGAGNVWAYTVSALTDGASVVAGYFEGAASFGDTELVGVGSPDVFVAKLSASGEWEWVVGALGEENVFADGVNTLGDGSSIIAGLFGATGDFGDTELVSAGFFDAFVMKLPANP